MVRIALFGLRSYLLLLLAIILISFVRFTLKARSTPPVPPTSSPAPVLASSPTTAPAQP